MNFTKIVYSALNARQKENFNFQKISAVLADYGFVTLRLSDDWQGADFIALHISGQVLRVQLKGRCCFYQKYEGKELHVAFPDGSDWFLYPHDQLLPTVLNLTTISSTRSWKIDGGYSFPRLTPAIRALLEPYRICGHTLPMPILEDDSEDSAER